MTSEQFAYWLNGFVELNGQAQPTPEQWASITEHLKTVFVKVTPPVKAPAIPPAMPRDFDDALRRYRENEQRMRSIYSPPYVTMPAIC